LKKAGKPADDEDEDQIDDIYEKVQPQQREKYLKDMTKFLAWLKDQEDENEEEEEEEEDDEEEEDEEEEEDNEGDK
jgi:hypothetical protein